jgi:hypothetical protein
MKPKTVLVVRPASIDNLYVLWLRKPARKSFR